MRSLWTGTIGFGLVNIPVKLFSATQGSELDLDMLDKKDHANIKFKRVNEKSGKEVAWKDIVKGYLFNDRYVILDNKDFEAASAAKSKVIEINEFVQEDEISSLYYETPYYLVPEKSGTRAYSLLRDALLKTGKTGIGTFVMRNKESMVALKAMKEVIVLNKLRFAQEIRDPKELKIPNESTVKPAELKMAVSLINQLSAKFKADAYKDNYSAELIKLIKAKSKGAKIARPVMKIVHSVKNDLTAQLKASLSGKPSKKAS